MAFTGWPPAAVDFFTGLAADNSKAYWTAHKAVYESAVLAPMAALVADLAPELGPGRISRPFRDLRFSPDKTPYKTSCYAMFDAGGYVKVSADGLTAATGAYRMTAGQLDRYRAGVAGAPGAALAAEVAALRADGVRVGGAQELKTVPKGFPREHPRADLLRYKGVIAWQDWPAGPWLASPEPHDRVVGFLRRTAPLRAWLADL